MYKRQEQEIAALEKQRKALQGNVKLLKAVEKVTPDLDAIQPENTLTGAVKGAVSYTHLDVYKRQIPDSNGEQQRLEGLMRKSRLSLDEAKEYKQNNRYFCYVKIGCTSAKCKCRGTQFK